MNVSTTGRAFAAGIAAIAWIGLIVQCVTTYSETLSLTVALWTLVAYFTITTNLLVALVFTFIAIKGNLPGSDAMVAGTMVSIALVGVVNALLLWGALELSGGSALVDKLLHVATPILVPLFWAFFARKGSLSWRDPWLWAIYPLAYLAYGITRGVATGKYAYPFLNAMKLGWQRTALNAFLIAIGFMVSGFAVVWIDHIVGSRADAFLQKSHGTE
jgi:hypothetical protein